MFEIKVQYKYDEGQFLFEQGDSITVVESFWHVEDTEDDMYYHGTLGKVEANGFWCAPESDETKELYIRFDEIEMVIRGDRVPFLSGTTARPRSEC